MFSTRLKDVAREKLNEFKQQYKCSEDYSPREQHPIIDDIVLLLTKENPVPRIKAFLTAISSVMVFDLLTSLGSSAEFREESKVEYPQKLAIARAAVKIIGSAECELLAGAFIFELIEAKMAPCFNIYILETGNANHAFVIIESKQGELALDPFFNICCPINQYWSHPKIVGYFRAVTQDPTWKYQDEYLRITSRYPLDISLEMLPLLKQQTDILVKLAHLQRGEELKKILAVCDYIHTLDETTYDVDVAAQYLKPVLVRHLITKGDDSITAVIKTAKHFEAIMPHCRLLDGLKKIDLNKSAIQSFIDLVRENKYEQALRSACNYPQGYLLAELLLQHKTPLSINVNAKAGLKERAAIHYAAENPDTRIYDLLIDHGADPKLLDKEGRCAEDIINEKRSNTPSNRK